MLFVKMKVCFILGTRCTEQSDTHSWRELGTVVEENVSFTLHDTRHEWYPQLANGGGDDGGSYRCVVVNGQIKRWKRGRERDEEQKRRGQCLM